MKNYSKCELAMMYAPDLSPRAATNRLMEWLHRNPQLMEELYALGYRDRQKIFLPMQVKVIFKHLGEP